MYVNDTIVGRVLIEWDVRRGMDDLPNINSAKTMARFLSVCFLVIHMVLCLLFWQTKVTPTAIFNVGSVIFYVPLVRTHTKGTPGPMGQPRVSGGRGPHDLRGTPLRLGQ